MPGGGSGYSNGYAHYEPQKETRIRRARSGGPRGGGGSGSFRVSPSASSSPSPQVDRVSSAPQWAAFDAAYFQSYSHVGIHEEMIKVLLVFWTFGALLVFKVGFRVLCAKCDTLGKVHQNLKLWPSSNPQTWPLCGFYSTAKKLLPFFRKVLGNLWFEEFFDKLWNYVRAMSVF